MPYNGGLNKENETTDFCLWNPLNKLQNSFISNSFSDQAIVHLQCTPFNTMRNSNQLKSIEIKGFHYFCIKLLYKPSLKVKKTQYIKNE
jgi:hypothetical protein